MKKVIKNKKGFTLVELIVCIAIIAILAAVLVPALMGYIKKSNLSKSKSNVQSAYTAISTYISDCEVSGTTYATTSAGLITEIKDAKKADLSTGYQITFNGTDVATVVYTNGKVTATLSATTGNVALTYDGKAVDDNGKEISASK